MKAPAAASALFVFTVLGSQVCLASNVGSPVYNPDNGTQTVGTPQRSQVYFDGSEGENKDKLRARKNCASDDKECKKE